MNWTVISAVNNEEVLRTCLLQSPDVRAASDILLQRGFRSASAAYNSGIQQAKTDVLVFVHQDVYLPEGWLREVESAMEMVAKQDPQWAVMGAWGVKKSGERFGHLYCAGSKRKMGKPFAGGIEVRTLDELVLILRKSSGLQFDEQLPGFHMYGTDICLEAERHGMKCYAISAFCIHNTNGYNMLPWHFWKSCLYIRRKWKRQLPIATPCAEITYAGWPMMRWNAVQAANILLGRHKAGKRVQDPAQVCRQVMGLAGC